MLSKLFGDPVAVLMALTSVVVCFAVPLGSTLFVLYKLGLYKLGILARCKAEMEGKDNEDGP
jgi:hypothetical protein